MVLTFNGSPVELTYFEGKLFNTRGFELGEVLWHLVDEVVKTLKVNMSDVEALLEEKPEYFGTLSDGRLVINNRGFNHLALFVSETPEAKEYQDWKFNRAQPSIGQEESYYSDGVAE